MTGITTWRQRQAGDYYPDTMSREARRLVAAVADRRDVLAWTRAGAPLREMADSVCRQLAVAIIAGPQQ